MFKKKVIIFVLIILASLVVEFFLQSARDAEAQTASKWWYTNNPAVVSVDGNTGAMTAIYPGIAIICSQPSKTVVTPTQCFTVILSQVIK